MAIKVSGKQTQIIPSEQAFPEFPDLLYGTTTEGVPYFDAQAYLKKHKPSASVEDFFTQYEIQIKALIDAYEINEEDICVLSKESQILIDGSLVYLFIAFVDPTFLAFMCDRIHEMFSTGVCVSDSYLLGKSQQRLGKEILQAMINEHN